MTVIIALLLLMSFMRDAVSFEMHRCESYEELKRGHEELLNEHLELLSRYDRLKEAL